jgi:hypothetical protein
VPGEIANDDIDYGGLGKEDPLVGSQGEEPLDRSAYVDPV